MVELKLTGTKYDELSAIYKYNEYHLYIYTSLEKDPVEQLFWGGATLYRNVVSDAGLQSMIVVVLQGRVIPPPKMLHLGVLQHVLGW